jgi:hypothetical protein
MPKVELIYFLGCPNVDRARSAIRTVGVPFTEVDQDQLPPGHLYRRYSSPSILVDGEIVAGAKTGAACSIIEWYEVSELICERFRGRNVKSSKT